MLEVTCNECGKTYEIQCTQEQLERWHSGTLIQIAMSNVPKDLRELLISGTCGKCFDEMFREVI